MKISKINLDNPCSENWDSMKVNQQGRFCDKCAKTVIDFSSMGSSEISQLVEQSKGSLCARLTGAQLKEPLPILNRDYTFNWSVPSTAASLLLAAAMINTYGTEAQAASFQTEFVEPDFRANSPIVQQPQSSIQSSAIRYKTLKGVIKNPEQTGGIENAKITFVTLTRMYSCYSDKNGNYELNVPEDFVQDKNVIRILFTEAVTDTSQNGLISGPFEPRDLIVTKEGFSLPLDIAAQHMMFYAGGIGHYQEFKEPLVFINGSKVNYREFLKAQNGEKSSCSIKDKGIMFFEAKYAAVIYGQKAEGGLFIVNDASQ